MASHDAIAQAIAQAGSLPAGQPAVSQRINTTGRDVPLGGPLTDNGMILGDISYTLKTDDSLLIDSQALLKLLRLVLAPAALDALATTIGTRTDIGSDELSVLGYNLDYDPATFGLILRISPALRASKSISIASRSAELMGTLEEPAGLSGYITAFANTDYVHRGFDRGLQTPNVLLNSAIRYRNFVLENEATLQGRFGRQATRVVYDDTARTARYSVGDLEPISRGFSGSTPMSGASIVRIYSELDPQRNIQPRGQRSFTLARPATVETIVNGQSVQQTRLGPGNYDIGDFPYAQGSNDVRLIVRDDTGSENIISFSINFDRSLLAAGLSEFGLFAGVRTPYRLTGRQYTGDPVASGFYRRGFSDVLTAGANFQAAQNGAVVGGEVNWATALGTIAVNLAASDISRIGMGYAFNIGYERTLGRGLYASSLAATFQLTSSSFATPTALTASNPYAYQFGATYSQSFGRDHFGSIDGFYSIGRGAVRNQGTARATYGWRATPRLLLTAEAAYEDRQVQRGFGFRLALNYRFSASSNGQVEVDTLRQRQRATYQTASGRGVGAYNLSATVEHSATATGVNGTGNYLFNRAEVGASHFTSFAARGGAIVDQRSSLRIGTALAFADGHFAVARPIYDSFAIVAPHRSLKGATVYVDPRNGQDFGRSGLLGGAVVSDLSSYYPRIVTYDVPAAPVGYNLGSGALQFLPPYRSGYYAQIGSDYSVTYMGTLQKADGTPLALEVGNATEVANPQRAPVRVLTNRAGRFAVEGLRPGQWQLEFASSGLRYMIDVPSGAEGLVRGGTIKPEGRRP